MDYRLEEKTGFTVVGFKKFVTTEGGENFHIIPQMWNDLPSEHYAELRELSNREPDGVIGVCADMYEGGFDYWIAAATDKPCPAHLEAFTIPAATWAVFTAVGPLPGAIQQLWGRIYNEWLPASGYGHAMIPEIEWYSDGDSTAADYQSEVWMPVVRK